MTWSATDPQGNESGKVVWEIVKWTRGRGLDVGCGGNKAYPHMIGVDNGADIKLFGHQFTPDIWIDHASDLRIFGTESMDFVFSSHLLEHIEPNKVVKTLREWLRVVKLSGYLVLYLPHEDFYPKVGEPHANPDHKWNVSYQALVDYMVKAGDWDLVDYQERNNDREYSLFAVFQKKRNGHAYSFKKEKPAKTAAVVRYGAFGDLLQASSVLAGLKEQGYHVTLYTSPPQHEVIEHDPNIDAFYFQDKDQVPNQYLDQFWSYHKKKFDLWVNLSESIEGTLLAIPSRANHGWSPELRHKMLDVNYLQFQHDIAGIPHKPQVKFFETQAEREWARKLRKDMEFVVVWSLAGSSVHKVWPWVDNVVKGLLLEFPNLHVVFVGGDAAVLLEQGWFYVNDDGLPRKDESGHKVSVVPRVHCYSGEWNIRKSLAFTKAADLVVGPETGVLNSVSNEPMPKVVFLSHSTQHNLTRDWVNTHSLISKETTCPGRGLVAGKVPACHQLHYSWDHCRRGDIQVDYKGESKSGIAKCQEDIGIEEAFRVIWHAVKWAMEAREVA